MADIIELVFGGALSLLVLYMLTPTIATSLGSAVDAVANVSGLSSAQSGLVTSVLVLVMIVFFILILYGFYRSVENDMD